MTTTRTGSACSLNVERSALEVEGSSRSPLRLLVISPEAEDPRELSVLAQLFAAGLTDYHLRKPTWTRDQLAAYLGALTPDHRSRIVLHTHHDLASEFAVAGLHDREAATSVCHSLSDKPSGRSMGIRSRAVHDRTVLRGALDSFDRLLVSPVFPSISKPGHVPDSRLKHAALADVLALPRRADVFALGGIDESRLATCHDLGFDGVAVLGAVWNTPDPVAAFRKLLSACSVLSANSVVH